QRATARYLRNLETVVNSPNMTRYERNRLETGIVKPSIFSGLPPKHNLGVPAMFGGDVMHLATLNIPDLYISLWRATIECDTRTDNKATWPFAIFQSPAKWKAHGQMVADAIPYTPGSFDRPSRNIAEKLTSGYKSWEFLLYFYGHCPCLLFGDLPEAYYVQFCKLVRATRVDMEVKISVELLRESDELTCEQSDEYENLYVQRRADRLHFVRASVHAPSHMPRETQRLGPSMLYSQYTMERTIGNLGEEIKQHSNPYANLSERAIRRCQINAIKALLPDIEPAQPSFPRRAHILHEGKYALLPRRDRLARPVTRAEALALQRFLEAQGDRTPVGDALKVRRWARLQLPNGQTARSRWKEEAMDPKHVRMSRNVKFMASEGQRFAEVHYYVLIPVHDQRYPLFFQDETARDRYYLVERPGLGILEKIGYHVRVSQMGAYSRVAFGQELTCTQDVRKSFPSLGYAHVQCILFRLHRRSDGLRLTYSLADFPSTDRWDHTMSRPSLPSPAPLHMGNMQLELAMQPSSSLLSQGLHSSISTSDYDVRMLLQRIKELEAQQALLTQRVHELQGELTGSKAAYNALLERLPSEGSPIIPGENTSRVRSGPLSTLAEAALRAVHNPPRIITLNRKDYRRIHFWYWSEFSARMKGQLDVTPLGPEEEEEESPGAYRFLEDEAGHCVEERKLITMREVLYSLWHTLLQVPGLLPEKWGKASFEVKMYVWATMEEAFVELRFCDGHWKAQRLATLNYPWWYRKHVRRANARSTSDESSCKLEGGGGHVRKSEGKRSAADAALESEQVTKKPKNKFKSIFPSCSSKKTSARSPLSTVTSAVTSTSTAASDATASSQLSTTTIITDTNSPPSPAAPSILHGASSSSSSAATPEATVVESTGEQVQQHATGASSDRAQEASPDASGHIESVYSVRE
ncbi:hypothetical protein HDZ31DRAFT_46513, partial [Schizophyllum fasciatum]